MVRDFLLVLDRVSKEVGKINKSMTVGSQCLSSVFPSFIEQRHFGSFDKQLDHGSINRS